MKYQNLASFALVSVCYVACGSKINQPHQDSEVFHKSNDPVVSYNSAQWHTVKSDAEAKIIVDSIVLQGKYGNMLGLENKMVRRLQAWSDAIYFKVLTEHPQAKGKIPRPIIRVLPSETWNAYVPAVRECLKITLFATNIDGPVNGSFFLSIDNQGATKAYLTPNAQKSFCSNPLESTEEKTRDVVKRIADMKPACAPKYISNKEIEILGSCLEQDANFPSGKVATTVSLPATPNLVIFYSKLITSAEQEQDVIPILAHELGHFYRAHSASVPFSYPFNLKTWQRTSGRPTKDNSLSSLAGDLEKLEQVTRWPTFSTLSFHPQTFILMNAFFESQRLNRKTEPCAKFSDAYSEVSGRPSYPMTSIEESNWKFSKKFDRNSTLRRFPFVKSLAEGQIGVFQSAESLFSICAKSLSTSNSDVVAFAGSLKSMAVLSEYSDETTFVINSSQKTLFDFVQTADLRFRQKQQENENRRTKLLSSGIAFYTFENEADEFGVEWSTKFGIKPEVFINTWKTLGALIEKTEQSQPYFKRITLSNGSYSERTVNDLSGNFNNFLAAECNEASKNNFADASNGLLWIPFGTNREPHHNTCWRAFNIAQESRSHNYPVLPRVENPVYPANLPQDLIQVFSDVKKAGGVPTWNDAVTDLKNQNFELSFERN